MTRRSYKIIKTTPMAPAGCHTHRHVGRDSYYKNMINLIHHIYFIHHIAFWPYHITRHMLQKQVRRPLIVVASFLCGCHRFVAKTFLTYAKTTT